MMGPEVGAGSGNEAAGREESLQASDILKYQPY